MKKKIAILLLALAAMVAFALFAGCEEGKKQKSVSLTGELGQVLDLNELEGADALAFYEFSVKSPKGEAVVLTDHYLYLGETGGYSVTAADTVWKIEVKDTQGPVVLFGGPLKDYFTGDTVVLPQIYVRDYSGDISDYDLNVYLGETKIDVSEENTFVVNEAGTYTVSVQAKDSSGNSIERESAFRVFRYSDKTVAADTAVSLTDADFGAKLDTSKEWQIAYEVYENGKTEPLSESAFTVKSGSYYEVYGTATEKGGTEQVHSYTFYQAEDLQVMSLNRTQDSASYGLTATGAAASVEEKDGNRYLKFQPTSLTVTVNLPASTLDATILEGSKVKVTIDCWVEGYEDFDFGSDPNHFLLSVGEGVQCHDDVFKGQATLTLQVQDGMVYFPVVVREKGKPFYFDNITFVNAGKHFASAETPLVKAEIGSTLSVSPELFGLKFTDFIGNELTPSIVSVRRYTENGAFTDLSAPYEFTSEKDYCYEIEYAAGEGALQASYTVRLIVGDVDVEAPVISFTGAQGVNRSVKVGTKVALTEQGLGISVKDDNEFDITYAVKKNGEAVAAEEITVQSGEYYEITVTAEDNKGNISAQYILIHAEDCKILTFDDMSADLLKSLNFVCNTLRPNDNIKVNSTRKLVEENGNKAFSFTPGMGGVHLSTSWVASGVPSGKYNIQINFRFTGTVTAFYFCTDDEVQIGESLTGDGSLTLENAEVASDRFRFQMICNTDGEVLVDSIVFIPV